VSKKFSSFGNPRQQFYHWKFEFNLLLRAPDIKVLFLSIDELSTTPSSNGNKIVFLSSENINPHSM